MYKQIKGILTVFLGTCLNLLIGAVSIPIITRLIDPNGYGHFSILHSYISICATVCILGLEQAYVRFYYREDSLSYHQKLSRSLIAKPLVISIVVVLAIMFFGEPILEVGKRAALLFSLCVIFTVIDTFTRLNVRLSQKNNLFSCLLVLHKTVYVLVAILLALFTNIDAVEILLFGTLFSLISVVILALIGRREIWFGRIDEDVSMLSNKEISQYSFPFVFSSIAGWLFPAAGSLILKYFTTYTDVGYYSAAGNIVAIISVIQTTFSTIWVPMAVKNFESDPNNKMFYVKSNDYITFIMAVLCATLIMCKDVFGWVLGTDYIQAKYIFPCLLLQPLLFTISETTVYGINFYKKTYWHIVITSCSCVTTIICAILLVPSLGAIGSAISTGVSYFVFFFIRTIISRKYYRIPFHYRRMMISIALVAIFGLYNSFNATSIIGFIMYCILIVNLFFLYRKEIESLANISLNYLKSVTLFRKV